MRMPRRPPVRRKWNAYRIIYGIVVGAVAIFLAVGGVAEINTGIVGGGVLCFVLAALLAWHDLRIWGLLRWRRRRR
jgi:hypothetical protein